MTSSGRGLGLVLLGLGLAVAGCTSGSWVIAEADSLAQPDSGAPPETPDAQGACPSWRDLEAERLSLYGPSALEPSHVGLWRGELEGVAAVSFPSSDVSLVLNADATGTLTFSNVDSPAPAQDPDAAYLCDGATSGGVCGTPSGFVGGFSYELEGLVSRGRVVSFAVLAAGPWQSFCRLQTPSEYADSAVSCGRAFAARAPAESSWSPTGCERIVGLDSEPIDCGLMYDLERCDCAFDGCFASVHRNIEVGLNLASSEQQLQGSLWFESERDAALLRLDRQPR